MCCTSNSSCRIAFLRLLTFGITVAIVLADSIDPVPGTVFCPKICTCDVIKGLKRADCSNEHLINTYTDVPFGVEILDLSINIISSIEDDSFGHYHNLVKLFLSENSIQTISLDAFTNQQRLTTLDLSYNRLEQLHEQLFERNLQLEELNLSGNNFMMLSDKPFLKSYSIEYLHLANCHIPHVFDTLFIDLPNLKALDLSMNLMNGLTTVPFAHLRKMNSINLFANRWNCNTEEVRNTIRWMKTRVPDITVESCLKSDLTYLGNKFDRILVDPSLEKRNRHDVAIEEVWGNDDSQSPKAIVTLWPAFMNHTCSYSDHGDDPSKEACEQFVECQQKYGELYHTHKHLLARKGTKCSSYFRTGVFIGGVLIGTLFDTLRTSSTRQDEIYRNHEHTRQFLVNLFSKRQPRYVRSNSQLANLNNRYIPPTQIRGEPEAEGQHVTSRAVSYPAGNLWEQRFNNDPGVQDQMLATTHETTFRHSAEQQPTWISIRPNRQGTLTRTTQARRNSSTSGESPPPPYVECSLDTQPKEQRISMY
uniref:LRRCT domain-containing protein n=1 Tax=Anopheles farauti TaxID=69004 RepID=A0A182QJT8_9DIPT